MENNKVKIEGGEIDKEVLDILNNENVVNSLKDEKLMKRFVFNFCCETLSVLGKLGNSVKRLYDTVNICGAEKIRDYFEKVQKNYEEEVKRAKVREKIEQGHKKSKKTAKN